MKKRARLHYPLTQLCARMVCPQCAHARAYVCACGVCRPVRLYFSRQARGVPPLVYVRAYPYVQQYRVRLTLYFIARPRLNTGTFTSIDYN